MKQNKLVYQAPEAEVFEVKIDGGMLMASGGYGSKGAAGDDLEESSNSYEL